MFTVSLLVLSLLSSCGATKGKIIGGNEVTKHSRPYMVSVQIKKEHMCGGMLIRKNYVLTAAHCVDTIECSAKDKLEVVLGAHNISQKEPQQQRIKVRKCVVHPCYKKKGRFNDIMLLKLKSKAKLNNYVNITALPEENEEVSANQICSIAGWGETLLNSTESSVLREVKLEVMNNTECKNRWQQIFDTDNMICTASDGKKAFCQGDSGSPLICGNKPQGFAAYTYRWSCLNQDHPEVYMKISYFVPWINDVIKARK